MIGVMVCRCCVVLALLVACSKAPSEDQCRKLLEHVVDLELKKAGVGSAEGAKADIDKLRAQVADVKAPEFVETCTTKTSRARVECALAATTVDCPEGQHDCGSLADCDSK
jgi:hypothetical protein